jgi:hypothetical protein
MSHGEWRQDGASEKSRKKVVNYTGTDALEVGYLLCYDRDYGTAANADVNRAWRVEKSTATNINWFAGVVTQRKSAGQTASGSTLVEIEEPAGQMVQMYTTENCTIETTLLSVVVGSYYAGGIGEGVVIGRAYQTVNRSSTNGLVQAQLFGEDRRALTLTNTAAGRGPSPVIWDTCPEQLILRDPTLGFVYWNDFLGDYVLANNQTVTHLDHGVCGCTAATSGSTIGMLADEPNGVCVLSSTTDNEDAIISALGGLNTAGQVLFNRALWFEARIKSVNTTDSRYNLFCGFAEEGLVATTTLIANTDAMVDKDYVGFQRVFADGDKLDTVWNTESGATSPVTEGADAVTTVADTFNKVGIYCDGTTCYFYGDGVVLSDSITVATADFPDDQEMAFYFGLMLGHGDDATASIDWVKVAQLF